MERRVGETTENFVKIMTIYEELGIKPFINAAGTYTVIGGSRMSEETLKHVCEASRQHVSIEELLETVQHNIADMTHNEAAVVCNGAATGLYLSTLACVSLKLGKATKYISIPEIQNYEVLAMNAHHIPYDFAVSQTGVRQCWIGYSNIEGSISVEDLEHAIHEQTVAIFYYISSPHGLHTAGALSLEETIAVGRKYNVPVIVDAAAQLPPIENIWNFTKMGATAVLFSGGKDLCGPQSSGLIVGKKKLLSIIQQTNFPNYGYGRMLKIGREEIVGLYCAVKQYLKKDYNRRNVFVEETISYILKEFINSTIYTMERVFPNEAGQALAYIRVSLKINNSIHKLEKDLRQEEPSVFVKPERDVLYINPMTLRDNEIKDVIQKLRIIENKYIKEEQHNDKKSTQ